jgi:hypothetical protein
VLLPGPVAQYCVSYTMKNTQQEDTLQYELVRAATEKMLCKVKVNDTCHSVALRRLIGTSFAHQSNNIVGAAMASYLTRNASRFYFSHSFSWCPLRDISKLLNGEQVSANVSFTEYQAYFQCQALHYLCRPRDLEDTNVFDFYTRYKVLKVNSNNEEGLLKFKKVDGSNTLPTTKTHVSFVKVSNYGTPSHLLKYFSMTSQTPQHLVVTFFPNDCKLIVIWNSTV